MLKAVTTKDTKPRRAALDGTKKKGRAGTRPLGTFPTHAVSRKNYLGGAFGVGVVGLGTAGFGAAGLAAPPAGAGAGTPDCAL